MPELCRASATVARPRSGAVDNASLEVPEGRERTFAAHCAEFVQRAQARVREVIALRGIGAKPAARGERVTTYRRLQHGRAYRADVQNGSGALQAGA